MAASNLAVDNFTSESEASSSKSETYSRAAKSQPAAGGEFDFSPDPSGRKSVQIIAQRRAGRLNAASISDSEVQQLSDERQSLINRKFESGLSEREERRLRFVRWSLDRIQDARHGETLDKLETAIEAYEKIASEIQSLVNQLNNIANPRRNQ